jgi:hypothetical protein
MSEMSLFSYSSNPGRSVPEATQPARERLLTFAVVSSLAAGTLIVVAALAGSL